jgi:hypothetical protein
MSFAKPPFQGNFPLLISRSMTSGRAPSNDIKIVRDGDALSSAEA